VVAVTDTVTVRDVTVSHPADDDSDDALTCDHKRRSAAFEGADCCYACFEGGQR